MVEHRFNPQIDHLTSLCYLLGCSCMAIVKCKICGKEFYVKPSHLKLGYGKYCSINCRSKGQLRGKFVKCYACGKKIWKAPKSLKRSRSGKFFCTKSCQTSWRNKYYSGSKHPNWKGGAFRSYRQLLINQKIPRICKICGIKDTRVLLAHHVDKNRRNNDKENLVWLCWNCHHLVHIHKIKLK